MAFKGDGSRNRGAGRADSAPGGRSNTRGKEGKARDMSPTLKSALETQFTSLGSGLGTGPGTQGPAAPGARPQRDLSGRIAAARNKPKPGDTFGRVARAVIGAVVPGPFGLAMGIGDEMGNRVRDLQADVDAGFKTSKRADTPEMGRVDIVNGRANSYGNPAADDRARNRNGLGGGMTSGGGGSADITAANEERKRRRAAAQQTALGSINESLLGPGVLPI